MAADLTALRDDHGPAILAGAAVAAVLMWIAPTRAGASAGAQSTG